MLTGVLAAVVIFVLAPIFGAIAQALLARSRWQRYSRSASGPRAP
jgi:hypothetical protein